MREVETFQPLAPADFRQEYQWYLPINQRQRDYLPAGLRSDHEVEVLDDLGGDVLVATEFDVLASCRASGARRPAW